MTGRPLRALSTIGLSSYSMYLLHPTIMRVVGAWVPGTGIARRVVVWTAVIAGSYAFYLLVERRRPMTEEPGAEGVPPGAKS